MKLKHITFTGIDERTDIAALRRIQSLCPYVEFGVLLSRNQAENGNRFPPKEVLDRLAASGLNLSAHLCGSAAIKGAEGYWPYINKNIMHGHIDMFKRIQLNVSARQDKPSRISSLFTKREIIIQQSSIEDDMLYRSSAWLTGKLSVLIDPSGGVGKESDIVPYPAAWCPKSGYAGGINENNVADKLRFLLDSPQIEDFWIDMETGVRTDDWFDIDKVKRVLEICDKILSEM